MINYTGKRLDFGTRYEVCLCLSHFDFACIYIYIKTLLALGVKIFRSWSDSTGGHSQWKRAINRGRLFQWIKSKDIQCLMPRATPVTWVKNLNRGQAQVDSQKAFNGSKSCVRFLLKMQWKNIKTQFSQNPLMGGFWNLWDNLGHNKKKNG